MLEPENIKIGAVFLSAAVSKFLAPYVAQIPPDKSFSDWIERGGTGLCIILLIYGLKKVTGRLIERDNRLDLMHEKEIETHQKSIEARIELANSQAKVADALNNLAKQNGELIQKASIIINQPPK